MRETKTGFGAKVNGNYAAEGGLEPDDDDSDGEDIGDEEEEDGEIGDDDGSEGDDASDHNFWVNTWPPIWRVNTPNLARILFVY